MTELTLDCGAVAPLSKRQQAAVVRYGFPILVYVVATIATGANWLGDTVDYVESIVQFSHGVNHWMWDFAHLLWRPLGWVLATAFAPITTMFVGRDEHLSVMLTLNSISWLAGLVCVICIHSLATRVSGRAWIANVVALAFVFSQVFLNWTQAGSAYVPGLALMLVAFNLLTAGGNEDLRRSLLAGAALAGAVCLWVPYLLVVPTALLAPLVLFGFTRERFRFALHTAIAFSFLTGSAYLAVMIGLRITTVSEFKAWIAASGHGVDYAGVKRMVIGFARAFIYTGNDGLLFKRYFLADPFNPVSFRELLGVTLLKLGLVYFFVATLLIALFRNARVFALFIVSALPVLALAFFFAGSEPERYMPLFPMLFIAIAACLSKPSPMFRATAIGFFAVMIVVNVAAVARPVLDRKQGTVVSRVHDLLPRLDDRALIFAATYQDDLMIFNRTYPFHPLNRSGRLHLSALVSPGTSWNVHWAEDFATRALATWKSGGTTWVSKRALSNRPRSEWNWAEGDDRRVSWADFPHLFSHMDLGDSVGGEDGFVQLLPSARNESYLSKLTTAGLVAERQHK